MKEVKDGCSAHQGTANSHPAVSRDTFLFKPIHINTHSISKRGVKQSQGLMTRKQPCSSCTKANFSPEVHNTFKAERPLMSKVWLLKPGLHVLLCTHTDHRMLCADLYLPFITVIPQCKTSSQEQKLKKREKLHPRSYELSATAGMLQEKRELELKKPSAPNHTTTGRHELQLESIDEKLTIKCFLPDDSE